MNPDFPFSNSGFEPFKPDIRRALARMKKDSVIPRIWNKDFTVWGKRDEEISTRLGWLDAPDKYLKISAPFAFFAQNLMREGFTNALLLGMGGSSLAPRVLAEVFGSAKKYLKLDVLDSTDPESVLRFGRALPLDRTIVIVSSKSGMTLETKCLMDYFCALLQKNSGKERFGGQFAAITDSGTPLEQAARRLGFRAIFFGHPDIGGRFSVFSPFGLVPAALLGLDMRRLVNRGRATARLCRNPDLEKNPGAFLGALLGTLAQAGKDKAAFLISPAIEPLGAWLEQLLAESSGKDGRGILPLVRRPGFSVDNPGPDVFFVRIGVAGDRTDQSAIRRIRAAGVPLISLRPENPYGLGGQFFLWEMAMAVAGYFLGINPFNQPNVASSKKKTEAVLRNFRRLGGIPREGMSAGNRFLALYSGVRERGLKEAVERFLDMAKPGDYFAIQAFLPPTRRTDTGLQSVAAALRAKARCPVAFDYGPRFLHSTGQLHKGDRGNGLFIQLTAAHPEDVRVPGGTAASTSVFSFGTLIDAQARGDREALEEKGRRLIRIHFRSQISASLQALRQLLA
jgi:glucose-6-phosphate isomerase